MVLMSEESYELLYSFHIYINAIGQARVKLFGENLSFLPPGKRNLSLSESRTQIKTWILFAHFVFSKVQHLSNVSKRYIIYALEDHLNCSDTQTNNK